MKLDGHNILVTGASRGIGRGCAIELARAGANVGINYRSHPEEAEHVAAEVRGLGRTAVLLPCDVSKLDAVEQMVQNFVSETGRLDGIVSNAAYSDREMMIKADIAGFER
ncbi:MAG: SDR family NAD(P)-dependent oxidoreductase, partial [Planctomycetaceae bacterium]